MKRFSVKRFSSGRVLTICFGVLLLVSGIFLGTGHEPSWAAPGIHPDRQTVPPRPPPPPDPPDSGDDGGGGGGGSVSPPPAPPAQPPPAVSTPGVDEDANRDRAQPTPPSDREDFGDLDGILLIDPDVADIGADGGLVSPQLADLSLAKTVSNPRPQVGEAVSFTITTHNRGPDNATNVVVSEPLTSGLRLISASPTQGIFNQAGGLWTISAISAGQSATLTLVTTVIGSETMTNTVQVSGVDQFDPDSKPGNSLEQEDDQDTVQVEVASEIASAKISDTGPAAQPDDPQTTVETPSSPTTIPESILGIFGSLNWLYALIVGLLVIVIGLILTNRS